MLIGLHGKARSGKTTVANHLIEKYHFDEIVIVQPLKRLVMELFDMTREQVEGDELKEQIDCRYHRSPRWLLQHLGTDVFRKLYPNIWIDYAIRSYVRKLQQFKNRGRTIGAQPWVGIPMVVMSDVRFRNEKIAIERQSGLVWKIVREDRPGASSGIKGHASEHDLDSVPDSDYAAVLSARSGDVEGLLAQADKAIGKAMEEYS